MTLKFKFGIFIILVISLVTNLLALALPRVASDSLNEIFTGNSDLNTFAGKYLGLILAIFIFAIVQSVLANILSEIFAANTRAKLINKISGLSYNAVTKQTPAKFLTNLTSDIEAVKTLFNQGIVTAFSSVVLIIGATVSMLSINWQLALIVISIIPLLLISFAIIFKRIGKAFQEAQINLDTVNKIINESIVGAALVRVLNSRSFEETKFSHINEVSRKTNIKIVSGFASLIPIITILSNLAIIAVVYFGGSSIIDFVNSRGAEGLTPGDYSAFFTYVGTFIGPVLLIGFISSTIARSITSLKRINETLELEDDEVRGTVKKEIEGDILFTNITLEIDNRSILKDISFSIKPKTRVAIVGPTAAGKTQIFNLLAGLQQPTSGEIKIDRIKLNDLDTNTFFSQMGLVFQDNIIFNTSIKENIAFNKTVDDKILEKAIQTAELKDFIKGKDNGLDTVISERGSSLSGGQKQRLSLARALAINPKILLLDDFTARVDIKTERSILKNIKENFPNITLLSISQKIESVKDYDQILLIMEGELIAKGTHEELLKNSFEYLQIFNSQKTTE